MTEATVEERGVRGPRILQASAIALIVLAAAVLRAWNLGTLSFWYDEVVTMRLAEAPSVGDLFRLLFRIDATRAPLHPLILREWLAAFGTSEAAARSLSVVFGVATVILMLWLGRLAFDESTGLWAAFLGAISPLMIYYSREVRMYALLTLLATLCWALLFWMRRAPSRGKSIAYAACVVAMLFTHPLGLLMLGTLALASALDVRAFFGSWKTWLAIHLGVLVVAFPWLRFYFDHAPEFLSGRLPIKFLLATPIGFTGGNAAGLALVVGLIAIGLQRRRIADWSTGDWIAPACLALWLVAPPTILFAYSQVASPIFGPARYTVFCAPAYLVLIAQALSRIPPLSRWTFGLALALAAVVTMRTMVYAPDLKADWRSFAHVMAARQARPLRREAVMMVVAEPEPLPEMETARYYLERSCTVVSFDRARFDALVKRPDREVFLLVGPSGLGQLDPGLQGELHAFLIDAHPHRIAGLRIYRVKAPLPSPGPRPPAQAPASLQPPGPAPAPVTPAHPAPD
jgi:mannosyltransferase